jgi:hypothetical protein
MLYYILQHMLIEKLANQIRVIYVEEREDYALF